MDALTLVYFVIGLSVLLLGGESLVRGASRLAAAVGVSPLAIGLTVVAFGTSSPELAVSIQAGLSGSADICVGNIIGSNIFNVLFILGASALVRPLVVARQLVISELPVMIGTAVIAFLLALDGFIDRLEGCFLFAGLVAYVWILFARSRTETSSQGTAGWEVAGAALGVRRRRGGMLVDVALVGFGLGMLVVGSRCLVIAAVALARALGVGELVIGLTIIAVGTSLPEVATSIVAAARGERDIAVGNVVGSNVFNILAVLGLSAAVLPAGVTVSPQALRSEFPVMIAVSIACLPVFFTGHTIARWEGMLFLAYYAAYTVYLILDASHHAALGLYSDALLFFAIPLTALTLVVCAARCFRAQKS